MEKVIWTMWWQGEQSAPPIVRLCLASMRRHANGAQVRVLDKDTYQQYLTLPEHILRRVEAGQITLTHLSDIVRVQLLSERGGLWLDSTIFVTRDIPADIFAMPFFSINRREQGGYYIPRGRWCGYVLGGTDIVFDAVRRMLEEYWQDHRDMADYLLLDFCIDRCYDMLPQARAAIDAVPAYVGGKGELAVNCMKNTSMDEIRGLFQKMNWKRDYSALTEDSLLTKLMKEYGMDSQCVVGQTREEEAKRQRTIRGRYIRSIPRRLMTYGPALVFWESATALLEGTHSKAGERARARKNRAVKRHLEKLSSYRQPQAEAAALL